MTQSLTRRRAHLALLAALLALAAALFVAWPSASAAVKCAPTAKDATPVVTPLAVGESCTITTAETHLLQHTNITDRLIADMSSGDYVTGADGRKVGNGTTKKNFTASGSTVTVKALTPGEIIIIDTNEAAGNSSVDDEKFFIRVTNSSGGIHQSVCSASESMTSYLLVGDFCLLHTSDGAKLEHKLAAGESLADSKGVATLVDGVSGITFGAYGTSDDDKGTFTVTTAYGYKSSRWTEKPAILLEAKGVGTTTIGTHKIEVLADPVFEIVFLNDSDGIVKAGDPVRVGIQTKGVIRGVGWPTTHDETADPEYGFGTAAGTFDDYTVELSVPSSGIYFAQANDEYPVQKWSSGTVDWGKRKEWEPDTKRGFGASVQLYQLRMVDSGPGVGNYQNHSVDNNQHWYLLTAGAKPGDYTITAKVLGSDLRPNTVGRLAAGHTVTKTLTIASEVGQALGSATLSLAPNNTASVGQGESISVVVEVKNSLGNDANTSDMSSIILSAPGATIERGADSGTNNLTLSKDLQPKTTFTLTRKAAGSVDVKATVVGSSDSVASDTLTLTFAGKAQSIALGAASGRLGQAVTTDGDDGNKNMVTFEVTAEDTSDMTAAVKASAISVAVKDSSDKTAKGLKATAAQAKTGTGDDEKDDANKVTVTVKVTDAKVAPGTYTLEVSLKGKTSSKQTAEFMVSGPTASIAVSTDKSEVSPGDVVMVTANLTDADGNPVQDSATANVEFAAAGELELKGLGATDGTVNAKVKGGEATARFVVSKGAGVAVILVSQGAASGTASVKAAASEAEVASPAAPSLSCLSRMTGLSTWTCALEAKASEVFGLVSARGASVVHLWNGSAWVNYSVIDGQLVPGSNDFGVKQFDSIFISN